MEMPFELVQLLIFTIPGFFGVWSFRKANGSKDISDFEYLMFSMFWGVILLGFLAAASKETFTKALENIFAACIIFSLLSLFFGYIFGSIIKDKQLFAILWVKILDWTKRKF